MGIRHLNKYLIKNCKKKSIEKKHISILQDKFIVVDTSIYLYKFQSQNALHENFYLLISLFHKYNITPIFVFDGKPPVEKLDELDKRRNMKNEAEEKYKLLNNHLSTTMNDQEKEDIMLEMNKLKDQFVRISEKDIKTVKEIMDAYGVQYYHADGEADKECALIMSRTNCYACMSDDMDMFVYGCNRIIRNLNLSDETIMIYKLNEILYDLNLSFPLFKQITILSGTDYNIYDNENNLFETLKWYKEFKKENINKDGNYSFYEWLLENTKYIKNFNSLMNVHNIFIIDNIELKLSFNNIQINKNFDMDHLQQIMSNFGFMFT